MTFHQRENKRCSASIYMIFIVCNKRMQCKALCHGIYHLYINHNTIELFLYISTHLIITIISYTDGCIYYVISIWLRRSQAYHWLLTPPYITSMTIHHTNKSTLIHEHILWTYIINKLNPCRNFAVALIGVQ